MFLSSKTFFQKKKKTFFEQKSITLIKTLIFSKLFIWHLSRGIVRIESTGKGVAVEKSRTVIGWKRIDEKALFVYNLQVENEFFLSAESGIRSFNKSDFKSI